MGIEARSSPSDEAGTGRDEELDKTDGNIDTHGYTCRPDKAVDDDVNTDAMPMQLGPGADG